MAVKIGLVGTGTVGGGCIDIIQKHKDDFLRHFGVDIELARVCSLSPRIYHRSWNLGRTPPFPPNYHTEGRRF